MAVGACGGPHVEFRAGRIDATSAGGTGTPQPETDIQDTLTFASNAGFNTDDFIALTVCGHSMGGVHKAQFPQVFPDNYSGSLDGSDGRDDFDETDATFDNTVASDYVSSSGDKGGPLVTTSNVTVQSDLRLYSQDQNATIERMAGSDSYFESQCQSLFQRMIETVPGSTRLINPAVDPTSTTNLQPYDVSLSVDWAGNMELSGTFRYVQVSGATAAPSSLTVTLIDRDNDTTTTSTTADASGSDTGTGIWGPTSSYDFKLDFPASTGLGGVTAGGTTFNFQDTMFVDSSLSSVSPSPPAFAPGPGLNSAADYTINTTVAVSNSSISLPYSITSAPSLPNFHPASPLLSSTQLILFSLAQYLTTSPPTSLTATFSIPQPGNGSPAPTIDTSTTTTLSLIGTANGYAFYSGLTSKSLSGSQAYGTSVDVAVTGSAAGAMFFKPFGIV